MAKTHLQEVIGWCNGDVAAGTNPGPQPWPWLCVPAQWDMFHAGDTATSCPAPLLLCPPGAHRCVRRAQEMISLQEDYANEMFPEIKLILCSKALK